MLGTTPLFDRRLVAICLPLVVVTIALLGAASAKDSLNLPRPATGADEAIFLIPPDVTYFVDPIKGSDSRGTGVAKRPLKSLGHALNLAKRGYAKGLKIRIELLPGDYREENFFDGKWPNAKGYLHIVAAVKHQAVITGFDDWTGDGVSSKPWKEEPNGKFSKPWKRNWGFEKEGQVHGPYPDFDQSLITRREYVVMDDDAVLRQVLSQDELKPGTFFVDDQQNRVFLNPPLGKHPNRNRTLLATRPHAVPYQGWLWTFWNVQNLKFDGLVFTGSASYPNGANLHVARGCQNVVVENCSFRNNGTGGLNFVADDSNVPPKFSGVTDVTVRGCVVSDNGTSGFHGGCNNGLFLDNVFERNNVRGDWAGCSGWAIAAAKYVGANRVTLQDNKISGNHTGGLWFDISCTDVLVSECDIVDNLGRTVDGDTDERGIFVEISDGPTLIEDCEVCRNHIGIQVGNSCDVTIRDCTIADNLHTQIGLEGRPRGEQFPAHNERLAVTGNKITASGEDAFLIREVWSSSEANIKRSLSGLRSTQFYDNEYTSESPSTAFMGMDLKSDDPTWQIMTFNRWRRFVGMDQQGSTINGQTSLGGAAGEAFRADQFDDGRGVTVFDGGFGDLGFNDGTPDWVCYRGFDFGNGTDRVTFSLGVPESVAGGEFEIRLDSIDGPLLATVQAESTGGWSERGSQSESILTTSGHHDFFLVARTGSVIGNFYQVHFSSTSQAIPDDAE